MSFRPRPEHELDRLSDEELIAYIVAARDAGDFDAARTGLGILAWRRFGDVRSRARMKVPDPDVDDVAQEAMTSAVQAAFDGESMGEFVNLLHTITDRRIADYHRKREGKPANVPLPEEHEEAEEIWGDGATSEDFTGKVDLQSVINQALDEINPVHREVVELVVFERYTAKETAEKVNMSEDRPNPPMTEDNVHQIAKRFRDRLRELLGEARGDH